VARSRGYSHAFDVRRSVVSTADVFDLRERRPHVPLFAVVTLSDSALFIILRKRVAHQDKHWACGTVGAIVGFWLKG
jgi:hypothetical protein